MSRFRASISLLLTALLLGSTAAAADSPDSRPWTKVDDGRSGDHSWAVKLRRSEASGQLCVRVGLMVSHGPISYTRTRFRQCSDTSRKLAAKGQPLLAGGALLGSESSPAMTVLAMVLSPATHQVRVVFSGGADRTVPAQRPTPDQRRDIGAGELRYAVIAIRGASCAERVLRKGADGRVLGATGVFAGACGA